MANGDGGYIFVGVSDRQSLPLHFCWMKVRTIR
jgi:predicted HTH transcriptional regulator